MSLYALNLEKIISTLLGQNDHEDQHGVGAKC